MAEGDDYIAPDGRRRCPHCRAAQHTKALRPHPPIADRIAAKARLSGDCLLWTGARDSNGYGVIKINGVKRGAHRVAWEIHNGRTLLPDEQIRHACDTPLCVNHAHLAAGSNADNVRDKMERGRHRCGRGEGHGRSKLNRAQVADIRRRAANGTTAAAMAREFGVSQPTIQAVIHRTTWDYPGL